MMRRSLLVLLLWLAAAPAGRAQVGSLTVLHRLFPNTEGRLTYAPLAQGADGLFYGTASRGGAFDQGTVFRLDANGNNFTVLYAFTGPPGDGARPEGGLVQARDGRFYGATLAGGPNDRGLLYRLGTNGAGLQPLAAFNLGFPGATPTAELVQADDGNLYGSAEFGGFGNFGTVFRVTVPDGGLAEVAEFAGSPDAANPAGRLLRRSAANFSGGLYGATLAGGFANLGTIFRVNPDGSRQIVYSFTGNADGALPRPLAEDPSGNLYGVTRAGGPLNYGGVFQLNAFDGNFTLLYGFNPTDGTGYDAFAELLVASDGFLYGTTRRGGAFDAGTIYRVGPGGGYVTLYAFTGNGADGGYPQAALTQGSDGRLYGVAAGQQGEAATVFRLDLGLPRPRPVVRTLSPSNGRVGDPVVLLGENLVGATGVRFPAATAGGAAPVAPLTVVSARYATFTVPAGAGSGPLAVLDADNRPGPDSAGTFTVNPTTTPPPVASPEVVTLAATDPVAALGDPAQPGRFRLTRNGGDAGTAAGPLTVRFKVQAASTARRDVDYQLANRGVVLPAGTNAVTLPAGKFSTGLEVVPLPGGRAGTVKIKLAADPAGAYTPGNSTKGTVTIQ